jgi:KUP system potassium uptake protein
LPLLAALFGAGLLFGDGVITPAISVLGAMEGLSEQNSDLSHLVVPITIAILVALFVVQRFGTGKIGGVFGWIMLVWFVAIGIAGARWVIKAPEVLQAIDPRYGLAMLTTHGWHGFLLLGSVFLVVTGGEALYADMGHFGRGPIRWAWYVVVLPGLLLNYFGQAALFLHHAPGTIKNPFYGLVEGPLVVPMLVLATMAAVIASQALISGVFSLTRQAIQLGFWPRLTVIHTSAEAEGQIYIPEMNYLMMIGCLVLVLQFRTSSALAAAYGIAVTGTMAITSMLFYRVAVAALAVAAHPRRAVARGVHGVRRRVPGGVRDQGARRRLVPAVGRRRGVRDHDDVVARPGRAGEDHGRRRGPGRPVPGRSRAEPAAPRRGHRGVHDLGHRQRAQRRAPPRQAQPGAAPGGGAVLGGDRAGAVGVARDNRLERDGPMGQGLFRVVVHSGFMQSPDIPAVIARCAAERGLTAKPMTTTYFLGRQTLLVTGRAPMARWRKMLFAFLAHNSRSPTTFFNLPPNRVVELGLQIEL